MAYGMRVGGMFDGPDLLAGQSIIASSGGDRNACANRLLCQSRKRTPPLSCVCRESPTDMPRTVRGWGPARLGDEVEPRCQGIEPLRTVRGATADMFALRWNQHEERIRRKETKECGQRPEVLPQL